VLIAIILVAATLLATHTPYPAYFAGARFIHFLLGPATVALAVPLARNLEPAFGEVQKLTPSIDALYVPNVDDALDEESAKRRFWDAFRALGGWYDALPPY
jgi:hypothetical protein